MVFFTFSVAAPESIAGDYDVVPADFGGKHNEGVATMGLVDCGDKKSRSRRELNRKMAMCRQTSKYSDYEMCLAQQMSYAKAVLLIKEKRSAPTAMVLPVGIRNKITIPCYMVSRADGQALSSACESETVTILLVAHVVDMYSWGNGTQGQLGLSTAESFVSQSVPRLAVQEKGIQTIACGTAHTLVLLDNGTLFSFGLGEDGQLGHGEYSAASTPVFLEKMAEQTLVSSIACGAIHSLAAGVVSGVWSWGSNSYLQLGHSPSEEMVNEPIACPEMKSRPIKYLAGGYFHTLACAVNYKQTESERAEEKTFRAAKQKAEVMKGKSNSKMSNLPDWLQKAVNSDTDSKDRKKEEKRERVQLAKTEEKMMKNKQQTKNEVRTLYSWGDGGQGQLGHGNLYTEAFFFESNPKAGSATKLRNFTQLMQPRMVEYIVEATTADKLGQICALAAWGQQSALLTTKGKVLTWGKGEYGRLGHGDEKNRHYPTLVTGFNAKGSTDEQIKSIAIAQFSMLALSRDANLYTWGANQAGQLGLAQSKDPDAPKIRFLACPSAIKSISKKGVQQICCGDTHLGGVTENGEVFIWGQDEGGRLGRESSPDVPVCWEPWTMECRELNGTDVGFMAMGSSHTMILTNRYPADDTSNLNNASSLMLDGSEPEPIVAVSIFSACCNIS